MLDDEGYVLNFHSQKILGKNHSQNGEMPTTSLADFPFDEMFELSKTNLEDTIPDLPELINTNLMSVLYANKYFIIKNRTF